MTELETRLRVVMQTAAPERLDTTGLAAGAHRYAASSRRRRVASTALAAVVVVGVVGTAMSGLFRDRAAEPAVPRPSTSTLPINLCPDLQKTITPLTSLPSGPLSSRADAVLVCALTGGDSVWPGSLPPDEAVAEPAALDLLDWRLKDDESAPQCGDRPHGRAFTVSWRDLQGGPHSHVNSDLLCDGWVFLDSFYVALSEQGIDYWAHQPAQDSYPVCPSILPGLGDPSSRQTGPSAAVQKGLRLVAATVCAHPTVNPFAVTADEVPRMLYVRRGPMGELDLAKLNADLTRDDTFVASTGCPERAPINVTFVVRAVTFMGREVDLRAPAACREFTVNNDKAATVTLEQDTVDAITGPLDRFP